jgi:hypothetical protein
MKLHHFPVEVTISPMRKIFFFLMLVLTLGGCATQKSKSDHLNYDPDAQDKRFFSHGWLNPPNEHRSDMGLED